MLTSDISRQAAGPTRILVIEDEPLVAMLIESELGDLGCETVGPVRHLSDAMDIARTGTFDAAIVDIYLDGGPTYAVADILEARGIPFMFSSGMPRAAIEGKWAARPYLAKPHTSEDMRGMLAGLSP